MLSGLIADGGALSDNRQRSINADQGAAETCRFRLLDRVEEVRVTIDERDLKSFSNAIGYTVQRGGSW